LDNLFEVAHSAHRPDDDEMMNIWGSLQEGKAA